MPLCCSLLPQREMSVQLTQELQQNNLAMLSAVRELSEEQEKTREDIRAEVQAEKDQHLEELRKMLASIRHTREAEKVMQLLHCHESLK